MRGKGPVRHFGMSLTIDTPLRLYWQFPNHLASSGVGVWNKW
jgi:hypothetical protein